LAGEGSIRLGRFEARAAADRGDHQVQGGVLGVAALVDEFFAGGFGGADLDELPAVLEIVLAEVSAKAALTVVNHLHDGLLSGGKDISALTVPTVTLLDLILIKQIHRLRVQRWGDCGDFPAC